MSEPIGGRSPSKRQSETFVVHARTNTSCVSVGTEDAVDALGRASAMGGPEPVISITDRGGSADTAEELSALVLSDDYAKPGSSQRF